MVRIKFCEKCKGLIWVPWGGFVYSQKRVSSNKKSVYSKGNGAKPLLDFFLNKSIPKAQHYKRAFSVKYLYISVKPFLIQFRMFVISICRGSE